MIRSNVAFDLGAIMHSCGGIANAIMVLNEPNSQERCYLDCQVQFLHDNYSKIKAINPDCQVIFWNGPYPSTGWIEDLVRRWIELYNTPFPSVDIGVHLYTNLHNTQSSQEAYEVEANHTALVKAEVAIRFRNAVAKLIPGANLIVTEMGSLMNRACYRASLNTVPYLLEENIPVAPFLWGHDVAYRFTTLGDKRGPTKLGERYKRKIALAGF